MPNFVALGLLEVGEKFVGGVVGGGWVRAFRYHLPSYTNLKLG